MKRAVDYIGGGAGLIVMAVVGVLCLLVLGQAITAFVGDKAGLGVGYLIGVVILFAGGVAIARMVKKSTAN
ncbi:MAG: hypothetical protein FJ320_02110 [SAR202 cluster bacterium]|nr:hypothetical protein [SAR202 cluster bacterium]